MKKDKKIIKNWNASLKFGTFMIYCLKLLCSVEKWRTNNSQNQRRVILNMLYERSLNNCWKPCLVLLFHRSMSTLIFQKTFVAMTYFVARVADASIWIGGVMVVTIVEMDPTSKIAVVRIFHFPIFWHVYLMSKLH